MIQLSILLVFSGGQNVLAQTLEQDIAFLVKMMPGQSEFNIKQEAKPESFLSQQTFELKLFLLGGIRFYQAFISTQDLPSCNFVPSCSRFSSAAFRHTNSIHALLLTSDRLQRCNGLPGMERHYRFLPEIGKYADPLENYIH